MTSTNRLPGLLALLAGLALALAAGPGRGQRHEGRGVDLGVFGAKGFIGKVVREGDRFVALRLREGGGLGVLRNFELRGAMLRVDGKFMGYDVRGKTKDVLVSGGRGPDTRDFRWEVSGGGKVGFRFRAARGALRGWWIGLGPIEPAKEGKRERAPLVLVKDKKDAASFSWPNPHDD